MRNVRAAPALTIAAWIAAATITVILVITRFLDAVAGEVGMDLGFWLDATDIARRGGDPYEADWYTYTPVMAWVFLPFPDRAQAMVVWTAASLTAGVLTIALVVAANRRLLPHWRAPLVFGIAAVTLLYSRVITIELFLGQNQLLIMMLLALAVFVALRWPTVSGIAVALAALVKTWPVLIGVWLFRAGAAGRIRALVGALATGAVFVTVMVIALGPASLTRLVDRTLSLGEQPLAVYSVWYFARQWPPSSDPPIPFAEAALGSQVVVLLLLVAVVALIVLAVTRPGTPSLSMWNVTGAVILLLPVSHPFYRLLVLPLLWVWCSHLLGGDRLRAAIPTLALIAWWLFAFRVVDPTDHTGWPQFVVVASTLSVVAISTVAAASLTRSPDAGATARSNPAS